MLLKQRKISYKDFAKMTNSSLSEIMEWLGGTYNFSLETLAKISAALGENLITV